MPRSRNPDKYPTVFKELLLAAYAAEDAGITWKCPDINIAQRTRMQLYAYVNAVDAREENMAVPEEFREAKRLHQIQITAQAESDGASIKLLNKNFAPENIAIQAALSVLGPLNPDTTEDKAAQAEAAAIIEAYEAEANHEEPAKLEDAPKDISSILEGDLSSLFKPQ